MYSKGKIITVTVVALVVLAIGIVKEGLNKGDLEEANAAYTKETYVSAQTTSTTETSAVAPEKHGCRRGKGPYEETLQQLKESGVLTVDDVKKIEEYNKSERDARLKEMINENINNMVKQNVITSAKGEKLKEALLKGIEK